MAPLIASGVPSWRRRVCGLISLFFLDPRQARFIQIPGIPAEGGCLLRARTYSDKSDMSSGFGKILRYGIFRLGKAPPGEHTVSRL
jgi:hypothetical protein